MDGHIKQIEQLKKLRAAVRVLVLKGKLKMSIKDVDDLNEDTLIQLLKEEEKEKMDSLNGSLSRAVIEASIEICRKGGVLKGETLDSLKKDLLENEVVTANAKLVVSYASSFVPLFGLFVATGFVGFYVLKSTIFSAPETPSKPVPTNPFGNTTKPTNPENVELPKTFQGF